MTWEIFAYWNVAQIATLMNAVAALVGAADFNGFLRTLALIGFLSVVMAVLANRFSLVDIGKWLFMMALVNGIMLAPKTTVVIHDRTGNSGDRIVANVPLGLAFMASTTSKFGDWLTRAFETVFSLPNDLTLQKNGLLFGHRVQKEMRQVSLAEKSSIFQYNMREYMRECVFPDVVSGYTTWDAILQSTDIWQAIRDTNPGRYVAIKDNTGAMMIPMICPQAWQWMNGAQVLPLAGQVEQMLAQSVYPGDPLAVPKLRGAIEASNNLFFQVARSAPDTIRQHAASNAVIDAVCSAMSSASFGATETAECLARSEAIRQTNTTYRVLAAVAESAMPKLRNAIEMIQYAVFPLIIAVAVAAGFGGLTILKAYGLSLIWVQLWPPLYAVVNFIMNSSAERFGAQFQGLAESAAASAGIITAMVDHQAIAGMLTIAIPPIAAALVKGGEVGLQAVAGMMTAPHAAAKAASEIGALGNLKAGSMDLRPAYDYGAPVQRHWQADGSALVTNAGGTQRLVGGTSVDQGLPFSVSSAGKESTAFTKASETMIRAAQTETDRAIESRAAAFESILERARQQAAGTRSGDMQFSQEERRFMEASREVQSIVDTYADKHQLTQSQRAALAAYAEAKVATSLGPLGKAMKAIGIDIEIGAGAKIEGMSAEEQARVREHAQQLAKETTFQKAIENLRAAGHRAESGSFSESGRRQVEALRASESRLQTAEHAAAASLERAQALRELAQRSESGEKIIQQDFTTLALDRLEREGATIDGHTYKPGELTRAEALRIYSQGNAAQRADLMRALDGATRKEIEQYVLTQAQNMPTAADIEAQHRNNKPQIDIQGAAAGNRREVETRMPAPGQVKPRHVEVPGGSAAPSPQQAGQMEVFRQRMEQAAEDPKKWTDLAGGAMKTAWNAGPSPWKAWKGEPDTPAIGRSEFPGGFDHGVKHQPSQPPAQAQAMPVQPQASTGFGLPEGQSVPQAPVQTQTPMSFGMPEGKAGGSNNPLTDVPGGSNLGKVFGGGQRTVVIQQAPEQAEQKGKDELPPPRG